MARSEIIDSHVHLVEYRSDDYPWITDDMPQLRRDFLPADLAPLMSAVGVAGCVAVQARQVVSETDRLLSLASRWPGINAVVGWVDLRSTDLSAQLEVWGDQPTLKGFRHVVIDEPEPDFLERSDVVAGIGELGRHGYTYDLLVLPHQLAGAARVARSLPGQQFVLDHAGLPDIRGGGLQEWAAEMGELAGCTNVAVKLSALDFRANWNSWQAADLRPYIETAFDLFGSRRLMIGSNWPVCTLSSTYDTTLAAVIDFVSVLTAEEQRDVFSATVRGTYRF